MTLKQLYYFQKLAQLQNYTLAAQELYISQPSLSYTIKELEKELNSPLFQKAGNGNHICLSPSGKLFLSYINEGLKNIEEGKSAVQQLITTQQNTLNIGYLHTSPLSSSSEIFQSFSQQPGCSQITIHQKIFNVEPELLEQLKKHQLNFAFCLNPGGGIEKFPVYQQELFVVVSKNHPLARHDSISFHEIKDEPCIQVGHADTINQCLSAIYRQHNCEPLISSFAGNISVALTYVLSNNCYTVAPMLPTFDFSKLAVLRIKEHPMSRSIYFAWRVNTEFRLQEQLFFDYIQKSFPQ